MSSDIQTKVDKAGSVEIAVRWCNECREIIGKGVRGTAKDVDQAITSINKTLNELDKLILSEDLSNQVSAQVELLKQQAFKLNVLKQNYETLKAEGAGKNVTKSKREEIKKEALKLQTIDGTLSELYTKESNRQEGLLKEIEKNCGKEIAKVWKEFDSRHKKLAGIAKGFAKDYDSETAKTAQRHVNEYSKIDWTRLETVSLAQSRLNEINRMIEIHEKTDKEMAEGKKEYEENLPKAQLLMQEAESVLPAKEHLEYLTTFSTGESAELAKNWILAGKSVNTKFVSSLQNKVQSAKGNFDIWVKCKEEFLGIKDEINKLKTDEYRTIALILVADIIALGDKTRDFKTAIDKFNAAKSEVSRILQVDSEVAKEQEELFKSCDEAVDKTNELAKTNIDASPFALIDQKKVLAIKSEFTQLVLKDALVAGVVPATGFPTQTSSELKKRLQVIREGIDNLPTSLEERKNQLAEAGDIRPLLEDVRIKLLAAQQDVLNFVASTGTPNTAWESSIKLAQEWLSTTENALTEGTLSQKFGDLDELRKKHVEALDKVIAEASLNPNDPPMQKIEQLRTTLTTALNNLEIALAKAKNLPIFGRQTWVTEAELEIVQIKAMLNTDSISVLESASSRVAMLKNKCDVLNNPPQQTVNDKEVYNVHKRKLDELMAGLKLKQTVTCMPKLASLYSQKVLSMLSELRSEGPANAFSKKDEWEKKITELRQEVSDRVFSSVKDIENLKKSGLEKIATLRKRLENEVCVAIETYQKKIVNPKSLPLTAKLNEIQGTVAVAQSVQSLEQIVVILQNLNEEIDWTIDDIKAGQWEFADAVTKFEEERLNDCIANTQLKNKYLEAEQAFKDARDAVNKMESKDTGEFNRYVKLYKDAKGAYKKNLLSDASKKMDLARRLMEALQANPLASSMTSRGQEHLKELNVRWTRAIETLSGSLTSLSGLIRGACDSASDEVEDKALAGKFPAVVQKKFNEKVLASVEKQFDAAAFQRELLVLQGKEPKENAQKQKDQENKKKYREQALVKVRNFKRVLSKHPTYQLVMFQNNPWSKESGGRVNALDLMRALNDIDLNVQRSVG